MWRWSLAWSTLKKMEIYKEKGIYIIEQLKAMSTDPYLTFIIQFLAEHLTKSIHLYNQLKHLIKKTKNWLLSPISSDTLAKHFYSCCTVTHSNCKQRVFQIDLEGRTPILGRWNLGIQNEVCHKIKTIFKEWCVDLLKKSEIA